MRKEDFEQLKEASKKVDAAQTSSAKDRAVQELQSVIHDVDKQIVRREERRQNKPD